VTATPATRQAFIAQNLALAPVPGVPEIQLYSTHPGSGLWRLAAEDDDTDPPYWAYPWGGGIVLARHLLDHPQKVRGARVLDLGCGGGVVGIAAALAGAKSVLAVDADAMAITAATMNAEANAVVVETLRCDVRRLKGQAVDLILVGDLFYELELAKAVSAFLDRAAKPPVEVLVGDPGRTTLPRRRLAPVASYRTADFGSASTPAEVFAWKAPAPALEP
jgi:predicted nicotinamide N-methyase